MQTEAPVGVSEVIVALCLPENGEDQAKTVVQNCCSQTTLATAVDDSAPGWTEFVHASLAGLARVPVSAGTVPRIRNFCGDLLRAEVLRSFAPETLPAHSVARASSPLSVDAQCECGCTVLCVWCKGSFPSLFAFPGGCRVGESSCCAAAQNLRDKSIR